MQGFSGFKGFTGLGLGFRVCVLIIVVILRRVKNIAIDYVLDQVQQKTLGFCLLQQPNSLRSGFRKFTIPYTFHFETLIHNCAIPDHTTGIPILDPYHLRVASTKNEG